MTRKHFQAAADRIVSWTLGGEINKDGRELITHFCCELFHAENPRFSAVRFRGWIDSRVSKYYKETPTP